MAEPHSPKTDAPDATGAPISKDAIDPDLIKLRRPRPQVGMVTAAGVCILCLLFYVRLGDDRRFAGSHARAVAVGDILAGKVEPEQLITVAAEPVVANVVRASTSKGQQGLRLAPVRGSGERLWLVLPGDGMRPLANPPSEAAQVRGRLRPLSALPFAPDVEAFLQRHPRPVFATPAAVRAALASGTLRTVSGDEVRPADHNEVAADLVDLESCVVVVTFGERLPDVPTWTKKLVEAGVLPSSETAPQQATDETARFAVAGSPSEVAQRLEKAGLWAARVEPVLRSLRGTWSELRTSSSEALRFGAAQVPDAQIDLLGVLTARGAPPGALVLVSGEEPERYWYVRPISYALLGFAALFAWVLVRAIRRDLLPAKGV